MDVHELQDLPDDQLQVYTAEAERRREQRRKEEAEEYWRKIHENEDRQYRAFFAEHDMEDTEDNRSFVAECALLYSELY